MKFMSKSLRKVIDEDHLKRMNSPLEQKLDTMKKVNKYKILIKELHVPKVSKSKASEMKILKGKEYDIAILVMCYSLLAFDPVL
jgi:hypothetical protein